MDSICIYLTIFLIVVVFVEHSLQVYSESIHATILKDYNRHMRPGRDVEKRSEVEMQMYILTIEDVDMKHQSVTIDMSVSLKWNDERLHWKQSSFKNTTWITLESKDIWTPDIMLSSHNASKVPVNFDNTLAKITSDGYVIVWPFLHVVLGTDIDVAKYPFDQQNLLFVFEAWTYPVQDLVFVIPNNFNPLDSHKPSGEWEMKGYQVMNSDVLYGDNESYHQAGYKVHIKRRVLYYNLHVIGPILLISLLNILCFVLPTSSGGERVTLSMTVFLTLTVFLSTVSDTLPKTSLGVPIIVVYVGLQMVGSALTIVMTVLIIDCQQRKPRCNLPRCLIPFLFFLLRSKNDTKIDKTNAVNSQSQVDAGASQVIQDAGEPFRQQIEEEIPPIESSLNWDKVLACTNKLCFWLAILWNFTLLIVMFIYVSK